MDASISAKIGMSTFLTWTRLLEVNELYVLVVRLSCGPNLVGLGDWCECAQSVGHSTAMESDILLV